MKFRPLRNKQRKKSVRLLKLIFPALSAMMLWKIFHKERHDRITIVEGLQHGELFWQSFFTHFQAKDGTTFWEILSGGTFCGVLAFSTVYFLGKKLLFLKFFALEKRFQGQGIGKEVIENLENFAKKEKYTLIFLLSSPFKRKVQWFYRKNGFRRIFWGLFWKRI